MFYLGPTRVFALPAGKLLGTPLGTFSATTVHGAPVQSRCGVSTATLIPQWGQRPATVPTKCHKRNLKATFSDPCASLWGVVANKSALCENLIIYNVLNTFCGSWRVPFHAQNGLENAMCTRRFLFESPLPTSGAKVTPKVAPRRAQGSPKGPRGRQKTPPRHLKTIKKSACDPTWSSKAAREARCKHGSRNEM